jgi:drug/metabolite transporter (DMT)-like permease
MADVGKYLAGVGIALLTTFMSALGMTLQKRSHQRLEAARERARRLRRPNKALSNARQPLWVTGIVLMAASSLLSLAVFALVGQSVASAFASITIIWAAILASCVLHERLTLLDVVVSALCVIGTVLVVYFGSRGSSGSGFLSLDDILALIQRPAAVVGWSCFGSATLLLGGFTLYVDHARVVGALSRHSSLFRATLLTRTITAGLFSGVVGFLSKAVVSVFASSTQDVAANLGRWEVYLFLLLLPAALVCQVGFLTSALRWFPATEAVPLYQSQVVVMGTLFGWTLYAEGAGKSAGQVRRRFGRVAVSTCRAHSPSTRAHSSLTHTRALPRRALP